MSDGMEGFEEEGGGGAEGAPAWMATFSDLMSLLFTFFVLLLSFANMDVVKFREMLGSVQDAFGVQTEHPGWVEARATSAVELSNKESTPFLDLIDMPTRPPPGRAMDQQMLADIQKVVQEQGLDDIVEAELSERGVTVRVTGRLLFDPGSAELKPEAHVFLDEIAELTKQSDYRLSIEGHTDDVPIRTAQYPSNWHLSAARAIAALRYLVEVAGIDPGRLSATGYADMKPLVPNDSPEHRAMNRRVEFVYYRDEEPEPPARSDGGPIGDVLGAR